MNGKARSNARNISVATGLDFSTVVGHFYNIDHFPTTPLCTQTEINWFYISSQYNIKVAYCESDFSVTKNFACKT